MWVCDPFWPQLLYPVYGTHRAVCSIAVVSLGMANKCVVHGDKSLWQRRSAREQRAVALVYEEWPQIGTPGRLVAMSREE